MTSSAIWGRFTAHLKAMDMYNGESVLSTRRGKMIASSIVHHATIEEVQATVPDSKMDLELMSICMTMGTHQN